MKQYQAEILIVGAGCAGTSLAHHLEQQGFGGRIVLLDERTGWQKEQRWCAWQIPPSLRALVAHQWNAWQVRDETNVARAGGTDLNYYQISAPQFFDYFHRRWQKSENVRLFDGTRVDELKETARGVEAHTARGVFHAKLAFDARHAGSGALRALEAPGHLHLRQSFVGWIVETSRPVFDAHTVTLMDFRLQNDAAGVSFAYILPYSPTRALVESTHFGVRAPAAFAHEKALHDYLARHVGARYRISAREAGQLPMASAPLRARIGRRVRAIGVAGGAARPSSGYAFARIQKQTELLAHQIVRADLAGARFISDARLSARKYAVLDEIFLQVLASDAALAQRCFMAMFARVPPAALVRFLSEQSSPADDARLIAALPKLAFCRASFARVLARAQANWRTPAPGDSGERNLAPGAPSRWARPRTERASSPSVPKPLP